MATAWLSCVMASRLNETVDSILAICNDPGDSLQCFVRLLDYIYTRQDTAWGCQPKKKKWLPCARYVGALFYRHTCKDSWVLDGLATVMAAFRSPPRVRWQRRCAAACMIVVPGCPKRHGEPYFLCQEPLLCSYLEVSRGVDVCRGLVLSSLAKAHVGAYKALSRSTAEPLWRRVHNGKVENMYGPQPAKAKNRASISVG